MTEPVIARRCPTCGASIRDAAAFCPQCGNGLSPADLGETQPLGTSQTEEVTPAGAATTLGDPAPPAATEARKEPAVDSSKNSQKKNRQKRQKEGSVKDPANESAPALVGQAARGAVGAKIQRATTIARDVRGDVVQRGQKVRHISSVVLDEAGYDPSLRFVLVAAVLFLLFVIIVLLNKFIS